MKDRETITADKKALNDQLSQYIIALKNISNQLTSIREKGVTENISKLEILCKLLPDLCIAFNSYGAFCATGEGEIKEVYLEEGFSINKKKVSKDTFPREILLPSSTDTSIKKRESIIIVNPNSIPEEMKNWGVKSLLATTLNSKSWDEYTIGIFNSKKDEYGIAYTSFDKDYLSYLMSILGTGLSYGYLQAESNLIFSRYEQAKKRGEYSFLSQASEACIKFIFDLNGDFEKRYIDIKPEPDSLMADFLNSELSKETYSLDYYNKKKDKNVNKGVDNNANEDTPISLIRLYLTKPLGFDISIYDKKIHTNRHIITEEPRTALSIARTCLWAGYFLNDFRVPKENLNNEALEKTLKDGFTDFEHRIIKDQNIVLDEDNKVNTDYAEKIDIKDLPVEIKNINNLDILFSSIPEMIVSNLLSDNGQFSTIFSIGKNITKNHFFSKKLSIIDNMLSNNDTTEFNLSLDYLRYFWQRMHYLSRNGMIEPNMNWIEEVYNLYLSVQPLTSSIIKRYFNTNMDNFRIDSDRVMIWLISNILLSSNINNYYKIEDNKNKNEPLSGPLEMMKYFSHLSHMVLYALHHIQFDNELNNDDNIENLFPFAEVQPEISVSLSKSVLFLISEYAYREIGVHRELVLLERLDRQIRYELPLYASSELYRDHLFHVIDVCLLGELILRSYINGRSTKPLFEIINIQQRYKDKKKILQEWYIAALCHDLGYVVERVNDFLNPAKSIKGPGLDQFWESLKKGFSVGDTEIKKKIKELLSQSKITLPIDADKISSTDHGVVAWLHLHNWLKEVNESPDDYENALHAIFRHNFSDQAPINPHDEPITFLLMLCDHLQEWGRPRIGPDPLARGVIESMRFNKPITLSPKIRVNDLEIENFKVYENGLVNKKYDCSACIGKGKCGKKCQRITTMISNQSCTFRLQHNESSIADFEPVISWLIFCRDLQCFSNQFNFFPFKISISFLHVPSQIWKEFNWQPLEMDLLQEFANTTESATFLCDWVEKARQGKNGISYYPNRKMGVEEFIINLDKLDFPLARTVEGKHIRHFINWKWRRLSQEYLETNLGHWFVANKK